MSTTTLLDAPHSMAASVPAVETAADRRLLDADSRAWLAGLRASGREQDEAVARLRELLLRGARFELGRRAEQLAALRVDDRDALAEECADDACLAVLARLDDFRGESRFTTWAYKFAILTTSTRVRRLAWRGRELPVADETWERLAGAASPEHEVEQSELLTAVTGAIASELTPHQRRVLVAVTVDGVPIDVLAERLSTTRNALYKTIHDARRRLRAHLERRGFE
jgi:RNA polymerase sigma-70 factor (ECF subfamily)